MESPLGVSGSNSPQVMSHPPRAVEPAAIERELAQLWRHEGAPDGEAPVTRACMSNLIAVCHSSDELATVNNEIPAIVCRHPARVLLLLADARQEGARLEAYVTTHAHIVEGRQQVVSEHVIIEARGAVVRGLPSAVRGLLVGDLPTALWWATSEAPSQGGQLFAELADLADQVIYDSLGWPNALHHPLATARWAVGDRARQAVSDLAWRRLKLWRRLMAQALDPAVAPGILQGVREIEVEHGHHAMTQAWLLTAWLALRLGWRPTKGAMTGETESRWQFQAPHGMVAVTIRHLGAGEAEIHTLRVVGASAGRTAAIRFATAGPGRLVATSDLAPSMVMTLSAVPQDRAELVARQLPDLARDPLFRDCLEFARSMARALGG